MRSNSALTSRLNCLCVLLTFEKHNTLKLTGQTGFVILGGLIYVGISRTTHLVSERTVSARQVYGFCIRQNKSIEFPDIQLQSKVFENFK